MTDSELLLAHLAGDQTAFGQLVRRHIDMVHAAAARQAPDLADDITQAVLILLLQKASSLKNRPSLTGWLFTTTRLCARHARRAAGRRRYHEREAAMQWTRADAADLTLLPLLDDALAALPAGDRDLILLRYLQERPLEELAAALRISVPAVTKRTQRAIERLRGWFSRRGRPVTASAVADVLVSEAAHRAPTSLAAGTASAGATAIVKAAGPYLILNLWLKAALAAALLILMAGAGFEIFAAQHPGVARAPLPAGTSRATAPASAPALASEPQNIYLAEFDILLDTPVADQLRKTAAPVESKSELYAAYRMPSEDLLADLREAKGAGQLLTPVTGRRNLATVRFTDFIRQREAPLFYISDYAFADQVQPRVFSSSVFPGAIGQGPPATSSAERNGNSLHIVMNQPSARIGGNLAAIRFDGNLGAGESLFMLADAGSNMPRPVTHALVWQAFLATPEKLSAMKIVNNAGLWIDRGPDGAGDLNDCALIWRRRAPETPIPPRFSHTLANGASVKLVAVGSPQKYPFVWWRPDGLPSPQEGRMPQPAVAGVQRQSYVSLATPRAVVIELEAPPDPSLIPPVAGGPWEWNGVRYFQTTKSQIYSAVGDGWPALEVGVCVGPWKNLDIMPVKAGDLKDQNVEVRVDAVAAETGTGGPGQNPVHVTSVAMQITANRQTETRVIAVDKTGKQYAPFAQDVLNANLPSLMLQTGQEENLPEFSTRYIVEKSDIDHFVVQVRHREWTTFTGYATEPSAPVPVKADPGEVAAIRRKMADEERASLEAANARHQIYLRDPDPATPPGAFAAISLRIHAGDAAEVRHSMAADTPEESELAKAFSELLIADESLYAAAVTQYGSHSVREVLKSDHAPTSFLESRLEDNWQIAGDSAYQPTTGAIMRRSDGTWQWVITRDYLAFGQNAPSLEKHARQLRDLKSQLDAGQFPTPESLAAAFKSPMRAPNTQAATQSAPSR